MKIITESFSISRFEDYADNLKFDGWTPNFIVVHNTSVPNQKLYKSWHERPNWTDSQWLKNLASYYSGMGWKGCPHLFVGYDKIHVLNDLRFPGTHSPSWNKFSWGIETIAEFENEPFEGGVKENLIAALGILHSRIGLNPEDYKLGVRGLHFHKEDKNTTHKTCPGKNLVKTQLIKDVLNYMNDDGDHIHIPINSHLEDTKQLDRDNRLFDNEWVQKQLNKFGNYNLKIDGILGNNSKEAVKDFQKKNNLKIDGIAGPVTRNVLNLI